MTLDSRRRRARKILKASAEDAVAHSTGLPVSLIKAAMNYAVPSWLRTPSYYVRWDDWDWVLNRYRDENPMRFTIPDDIVFPQVQMKLGKSPQKVVIELDSEPFRLDADLYARSEKPFRRYRWFHRNHFMSYHNGLLLRLSKLEQTAKGARLIVQPTDYESYCRTNLVLDAVIGAKERTLRDVVHPNGVLPAVSRLADPIGINVLISTVDNYLLLPLRSRRVIVRPSQLSPSYSGTIEWSDAENATELSDLCTWREGHEELHITPSELRDFKLLGLTKELVRGGQPELFFSASTTLSLREIRERHTGARDRWESRHPRSWVAWDTGPPEELNETRLIVYFSDLLERQRHRLSLPALTGLVLWMESLKKDKVELDDVGAPNVDDAG